MKSTNFSSVFTSAARDSLSAMQDETASSSRHISVTIKENAIFPVV